MEVKPPGVPTRPASRAPVLFAYGFRPFFLLAGLMAATGLAVWLLALATGTLSADGPAPRWWHGHEMLFGFVSAAVAGFLLTAVPNWTGGKALSGGPLIALVALWLAGRLAVNPIIPLPPVAALLVDAAFYPCLAAAVGPAIVRCGQRQNLLFPGLLLVLGVANGLDHALGAGWVQTDVGQRLAVGVMALILAIIGGRVVPAFTVNALRSRGVDVTPVGWSGLDTAALAAVVLLLLADVSGVGAGPTGLIALATAVLHGARLLRWHGHRVLDQPIVWVLHLGYAWLVAGFALKAAWLLAGTGTSTSWLHALTAGAFSTMILGIMTRAALGHTGRPLEVSPTVVAAYGVLTAAALARVCAPFWTGTGYQHAVTLAGGLWILAWVLYLVVYVPILLSPRADGRPG